MPPQRRILLAILILTASACYKPYVFSPPGRVALLETAKTVGDGAHSVGVHGGQSIVDDFRVNHLTVRYRFKIEILRSGQGRLRDSSRPHRAGRPPSGLQPTLGLPWAKPSKNITLGPFLSPTASKNKPLARFARPEAIKIGTVGSIREGKALKNGVTGRNLRAWAVRAEPEVPN